MNFRSRIAVGDIKPDEVFPRDQLKIDDAELSKHVERGDIVEVGPNGRAVDERVTLRKLVKQVHPGEQRSHAEGEAAPATRAIPNVGSPVAAATPAAAVPPVSK